MNKQILHIIDGLTLGGAEVLLKNTINILNEFEHTVVYMGGPNLFQDYYDKENIKCISLNYSGWLDFFPAMRKLKNIIRSSEPVIIHSHLFYSTLLSRFAVPPSIPLVSTLHSLYSKDAFEQNAKSLWAERLSIKKRHSIIAVSQVALEDYTEYINVKGKTFVLYNFLPDQFFKRKTEFATPEARFISVGTLKSAKNFEYLFEVFKYLKNDDISLDIYGDGPLRGNFQEIIDKNNLKIRLKGNTNNMPGVYRENDFYIQASTHEGFGLAVAEAMASGLPCFLSDIPVFHEVTGENAVFFPLNDPETAAFIIRSAIQDEERVKALSHEGFTLAQHKYSAGRYKQDLLAIYRDLVPDKIQFECVV